MFSRLVFLVSRRHRSLFSRSTPGPWQELNWEEVCGQEQQVLLLEEKLACLYTCLFSTRRMVILLVETEHLYIASIVAYPGKSLGLQGAIYTLLFQFLIISPSLCI